MAQYLLDTDICIELIKHNDRVLDKFEAIGADHCFVTEIYVVGKIQGLVPRFEMNMKEPE
jgi:predicted nucleic acid-binding protein